MLTIFQICQEASVCTAWSISWQRRLVWSKDKWADVGLGAVSCSNVSLIRTATLWLAQPVISFTPN